MIIERNTGGTGNSKTKLVSLEYAIELVMILPGKTAKSIRKKFADIITRYLDGDGLLCNEIKANQIMGKVNSYATFASKCLTQVENDNKRKSHEMPATCYVYATKSPAFPGLIKIGKTENVARRLSQLNTSCAPAPHVIIAVAPSFDESRDERAAHAFFSDRRHQGEFFALDEAEVLTYFKTHITAQYNKEFAENLSRLHGMVFH